MLVVAAVAITVAISYYMVALRNNNGTRDQLGRRSETRSTTVSAGYAAAKQDFLKANVSGNAAAEALALEQAVTTNADKVDFYESAGKFRGPLLPASDRIVARLGETITLDDYMYLDVFARGSADHVQFLAAKIAERAGPDNRNKEMWKYVSYHGNSQTREYAQKILALLESQ